MILHGPHNFLYRYFRFNVESIVFQEASLFHLRVLNSFSVSPALTILDWKRCFKFFFEKIELSMQHKSTLKSEDKPFLMDSLGSLWFTKRSTYSILIDFPLGACAISKNKYIDIFPSSNNNHSKSAKYESDTKPLLSGLSPSVQNPINQVNPAI